MTAIAATATATAAPPLRQDATVIGLVGLAHAVSHFSQLLLAPLFPWPAWRSTACRPTTSATAPTWRFSRPKKSARQSSAISTSQWTLRLAMCRPGM